MNFPIIGVCFTLLVISQVLAAEESDDQKEHALLYLTWRLSETVNNFAFKLNYQLSSTDGGNFVFSPISISKALASLHFGARGRTAKELEQILSYEPSNLTRSTASKAYRHLLTNLLVTKKPKQYAIELINTLFVNKHIGVSQTYARRIEEFYRMPIKQVNFLADGDEAVSEFNKMVQTKTKNKINHVIDKLDPDMDIISVNAAYFKGFWKHPFSAERTREEIFYNAGKEEKPVQMMESEGLYYFGKDRDMKLLELPIKGRNLSALFILPHNEEILFRIQQVATQYALLQYLQLMMEQKVAVTLPKFKFDSLVDISQILPLCGVNQLFQQENANLNGMIPQGTKVAVGNIQHAAVMEINEIGIGTPTAKSVPYQESESDGIESFYADHPFLFSIVDKRNGMVLIMGRVWSL